MLTAVKLRNFQKHKSLLAELDQVTTFVGSTDSGKSAIIRALKWVMLNQPRGNAFIRDGAKRCTVSIYFNGRVIQRVRGKENTYKLDGEVFKSFNNGVPDAIAEVLNVNELNFQQQHDASFWISLSPVELARKLNELINLDMMDRVIRKLVRQEADLKKRVEYETERLAECDKHLEDLEFVTTADEAFTLAESLSRKAHKTHTRLARLRFLKETLCNAEEAQKNAETVYYAAAAVASRMETARATEIKLKKITWLIKAAKRADEAAAYDFNVDDAVEMYNQQFALDRLSRLIETVSTSEKEITKCQSQIKHLSALAAKIPETNRVCEKCGQPIMGS